MVRIKRWAAVRHKNLFAIDKDVVIKAQALTGGRGLGYFKNGFQGGVHMCTKYVDLFWLKSTHEDAETNREGQAKTFAAKMLGETLVTKQTGERGIEVAKVGHKSVES